MTAYEYADALTYACLVHVIIVIPTITTIIIIITIQIISVAPDCPSTTGKLALYTDSFQR